MEKTEQPEIGKKYSMWDRCKKREPSEPITFFLYTGLQNTHNGKMHEFICTPLYMDTPCDKFILTRHFLENKFVMNCRGVVLDKSEYENIIVKAKTKEHKRLNDALVDYFDKIRLV